MRRSLENRRKSGHRREVAWKMHVDGVPQSAIALHLEITPARVSQLIKDYGRAHPITNLDAEERQALCEDRWNESEADIRREIRHQRDNGRVVTEVIRFPDGSEQIKTTHVSGVDPALLRAFSTHHDRRARQLQSQMGPEAGQANVNVAIVQDFLRQADGGPKAVSASEWNAIEAEQS